MFTVEQFKGTVYENGFGMIPKKIMCDKDLSSNAKLLYAFLASHSFNGGKATPKKTTINHLLGWGESRTDKALKELKLRGLIQIEKYLIPANERTNPKQRYRNHYVLINSLSDVIEISIKETKKEDQKPKESKVEVVKKENIKQKAPKINIENNISDQTDLSDIEFEKELRKTLESSNIKNVNQNTIKNIKKYSNKSISEVTKVIKYMQLKNKLMSPAILIAILKDKDYLIPEAVKPHKLTRKEKAELMFNKLNAEQIEKLKNEISKETGFPKESKEVKTFLESHLCSMFKKNYRY